MKFSGQQLRKARGERTIESLARELDVAWKTVWTWEKGHNEPNATTVARLAEITGHPIDFFFENEKSETPAV